MISCIRRVTAVTSNNLSTLDNLFKKKNSKDLKQLSRTSDVVYGFEKLLDCAPLQLSDLLQWHHSPRRGSTSGSHVCRHFQQHLGDSPATKTTTNIAPISSYLAAVPKDQHQNKTNLMNWATGKLGLGKVRLFIQDLSSTFHVEGHRLFVATNDSGSCDGGKHRCWPWTGTQFLDTLQGCASGFCVPRRQLVTLSRFCEDMMDALKSLSQIFSLSKAGSFSLSHPSAFALDKLDSNRKTEKDSSANRSRPQGLAKQRYN